MRLATRVLTAMAAVTIAVTGFATPSAAASLTVSGFCDSGDGVDPHRDVWCYAWPSGGTGSYSYAWSSLTPSTVLHDVTASAIGGQCDVNSSNTVRVAVTSGGETVVRDFPFSCRYDPYCL